MEQIVNYKNVRNIAREDSDEVEYTFLTKKAMGFYISSLLAVVCMFMNWLPIDLDFEFIELHNVFGTMNIFTLSGALGELKEGLGIFGSLLPEGYGITQFFGVVLMLIGVISIGCYAAAIVLRLMGKDEFVRLGKLGALTACVGSVGFLILACVCFRKVLGVGTLPEVAGTILKSPWSITLVCALVSAYCAVRNMEPKEDIVIYHNGKVRISRGPKWNCRCCGRRNLDLLEKCYYCGRDK